jgi:hypothetical protein
VQPGEIYRHEAFYRNEETGSFEAKFLVILATPATDDIVARLLTSRAHGRPESPACYQGHPYPSFFLGVLGGQLSAKSWVDLRYLDDFDGYEFRRRLTSTRIRPITLLGRDVVMQLLDCAAGAEDTTRIQARAIRDALASLRA